MENCHSKCCGSNFYLFLPSKFVNFFLDFVYEKNW